MLIKQVTSPEEYQTAAILFEEYAQGLGLDLEFQDFSNEIAHLETMYSKPEGLIGIAYGQNDSILGCFGIRKWDGTICELKRMYLRNTARGKGIGTQLLAHAIAMGTELGYSEMRLDTLPRMEAAIHLYEKMGFRAIAPYRYNPIAGARFYALPLPIEHP